MNRPRTVWRVKPRVLSTATSRVRSRMDMAIVFAETSKIAKTTAIQMLRMNALTFTIIATNSSPKAFSLSDYVGCGELRNMTSTEVAILLTSVEDAAQMLKVPDFPLNHGTASSIYFALN